MLVWKQLLHSAADRIPPGGVLLLLILLTAPSARAGTLVLRDGRVVEGREMERIADGSIRVEFDNGAVLVPASLIEFGVVESGPEWEPETDEEKAKFAEGLVPFEGRWISLTQRERLLERKLEERKAYIEEVKAHSQWKDRHREETKHFTFEYTVPPHVFTKYRDMMEEYFSVFAKEWKVRQSGRLLVCFYTSLREFHRTGGVGGGVQGYFKFVDPMELNFYYNHLDPAFTEEVMFHETNHYLQLLINPDFSMPHFPGESLAEYYGASRFDPRTGKLETGLILEGRLTEVQTDIASGEMMTLEKLLSQDMYQHYTWGWTFVHFLMNHKQHEKKFRKFVIGLCQDRSVQRQPVGFGKLTTATPDEVHRYFRRCMGIKDDAAFTELEAEWHAYVKEKLSLVTARGKDLAAAAALNTRRPILAKRLFAEAIEAGSTNAVTHQQYAKLLADEGKQDEAILLLRRAIELDPLQGVFYADLGEQLTKKGDGEGKRLLALAVEMSPDDFWLEDRVKRLLE